MSTTTQMLRLFRYAGFFCCLALLMAWAFGSALVPTTSPTTSPIELGPDTVVLKELVDQYEAVPFSHRSHAVMAQMWEGCITCHHRQPGAAASQPVDPAVVPASHPEALGSLTQEQVRQIPACKSCHPLISPEANFNMPNLQGAYHRQCLNCHREWMGSEKDCEICHHLRNKGSPLTTRATADDIVGRMHPPIKEPDEKIIRTRFTPAVGANVIFRHKEHITFGLKCADCHRKDTCTNCHAGNSTTLPATRSPMKPGRTWLESHSPCATCHQNTRCGHCHYKDNKPQPPPFDHHTTGQTLDKDHLSFKCLQCHTTLRSKVNMTCGDAACHRQDPSIAFPRQRPGPFTPTTRPVQVQAVVPMEPSKGVLR